MSPCASSHEGTDGEKRIRDLPGVASVAQVLSSALWKEDLEAMEKIIVEDNLNANTELATNEMDRPPCSSACVSLRCVGGVLALANPSS